MRYAWKSWTPYLAWPVLALVLSLLLWGLLQVHLQDEEKRARGVALQEVALHARSYAGQLYRSLEALDQMTLYIKHGWESSPAEFRLERFGLEAGRGHEAAFYGTIVGRNGRLLTSTIPDPRDANVRTEPFFRVHAESPGGRGLFVGLATEGHFSGQHVIPFSRRLADPDGRFAGVVLLSAKPEYFMAGYDDVALGKYGFLGILGPDNETRLARVGDKVFLPEDRPLVGPVRVFSENSGSAVESGGWFSDGRARFVSWQRTAGYDMTIVAGLDRETALAGFVSYRRAAINNAIALTAAFMLLGIGGGIASRRLHTRKRELDRVRATYRTATESGADGFFIARPRVHAGGQSDFRIEDCNARAADMLGLRREELVGFHIGDLFHTRAAQQLTALLTTAHERGLYEEDLDTSQLGLRAKRWFHLRVVRPDGDLAVTMRDVTDARLHLQELERRGNEDVLTGLHNRHWANTYLPQAAEDCASHGLRLALLFIDLDGFKAVNDTMGHDAGDDMLRHVARRLRDAVRPRDPVARIGGDEFLVLLERIGGPAEAAAVAERALDAFRRPFRTIKGSRTIGASIGISMYPQDGGDAETLLAAADAAMYMAKTSGKNGYRFFDQRFSDAIRDRHRRELELVHAIEHDQFVVYYQPRVEVATGTTCSFEALVRWAHPTRGIVGPDEFIPLAEERDLIVELGELVLDKVCAQLAFWATTGQAVVPVSINVSGKHFRDSRILRVLKEAIDRHGVPPHLVELEITEASVIDGGEEVIHAMHALQKMGIALLVDDFGTGYSSLAQLQRLEFDVLKVDRAFTRELNRSNEGRVLFTAIITMAHALGMRVVAEGVESREQLQTLKALRCDEAQGFYISRPLPPSVSQPMFTHRV
ncbi:bifunctional diguanylate cyclase/phosphodiesterase [Noviherbaspirillum aridicola]|uniref:PAS domain S-box-containing protein/diguanylate cyclase (GGDEF)-like protein n=1 Tax=Noviherbaspirillum aridicola TaxID=2849687 RepID=A0ABQ4Q7W7_9BURK|nr:EAL domain-containing protein [Noviherbaspirillum aridicola]GIZ53147.1 hypothetical protein NCCP691_31610 [Noviherbaspirillum aridicola]